MKTLVLSMISIAATVAAMTACTSESDEIDNVVEAPTEIKMSAGILNIETRSDGPIEALTADVKDVNFVKVDLVGGDIKDNAVTWGTDPSQHEAEIAKTSGDITFKETPYYSSDSKEFSYLIGYHPKTGGTLASNEVSYTIDGNMDIMLSTVVKGNKANKAPLTPSFSHKLAQLIIKITGDSGNPLTADKDAAAAAAAWGTISNIVVKSVPTNLKLDLSTGLLSAADATTTDLEITKKGSATAYPTISKSIEEAGYCMLLPQETAKAYVLTITTDKAERDVTVKIPAGGSRLENTTKAGESYIITLTFKANEIAATAAIDGWAEGSTAGAGDVD